MRDGWLKMNLKYRIREDRSFVVLHCIFPKALILEKAKKAGTKSLGGFSIDDAILAAFELGANEATESIRNMLQVDDNLCWDENEEDYDDEEDF